MSEILCQTNNDKLHVWSSIVFQFPTKGTCKAGNFLFHFRVAVCSCPPQHDSNLAHLWNELILCIFEADIQQFDQLDTNFLSYSKNNFIKIKSKPRNFWNQNFGSKIFQKQHLHYSVKGCLFILAAMAGSMNWASSLNPTRSIALKEKMRKLEIVCIRPMTSQYLLCHYLYG